MSGHSHYATIKRQKEANDAARGNAFSKIARAIVIAVKTGGGPDPDSNFKLRVEMDRARAVNMPKDNIDRAIARAVGGGEVLEEASYEGFGPGGIAVIIEAATDNKNRTGQEVKNLFERAGGNLAGPGAVSFNFEQKGVIVVEKKEDKESQMLALIDLGVEDLEETEDGIEIRVSPEKLSETKKRLEEAGFVVKSFELAKEAKTFLTISDPREAKKAITFLDSLNANEDIQKVFANLDVPEETVKQLSV